MAASAAARGVIGPVRMGPAWFRRAPGVVRWTAAVRLRAGAWKTASAGPAQRTPARPAEDADGSSDQSDLLCLYARQTDQCRARRRVQVRDDPLQTLGDECARSHRGR